MTRSMVTLPPRGRAHLEEPVGAAGADRRIGRVAALGRLGQRGHAARAQRQADQGGEGERAEGSGHGQGVFPRGARRVEAARTDSRGERSSRRSTMPRSPSTRTRSPVRSAMVAPGTLTTAGIPYSRATTAACESGPPSSVTTAAATRKRRKADVGGARGPGSPRRPPCRARPRRGAITQQRPSTTPPLAGRPVRRMPGAGGRRSKGRPADEGGRRIGPGRVAGMLGAAQAHHVADLRAAAAKGGDKLVVGAEEDAALGERGGVDAAEAAIERPRAMTRIIPRTRVTQVRIRSRRRVAQPPGCA